MHHQLRFQFSIISVALIILFGSESFAQNSTGPEILQGPDFAEITQTSATITWETDVPSIGFVAFGVDSSLPWGAGSMEITQNHEVTIDSLLPGSRYLIIVGVFDIDGNGPTLSDVVPFYTLEEETEPEEDTTGGHFFVLPGDTTIAVGQALHFMAFFEFNDGTVVDTVASWTLKGNSVGSITENGVLHTITPGFAHIKADFNDFSISTKVTVIDTLIDDSGINTISISRVLPNGKLQHAKEISEGESYKLHAFPSPLNFLNGGFIYFPSGSLDEDIAIHINVPKCAKTQGDSVEFDEGIFTGVSFDVFVNDSLVHPYYFKKPLIVSLPIRKGVLKKWNIDPANLGMFFMDDDVFDGSGINYTVVDSSAERVFSLVAHFSTLVVAEKEIEIISGVQNDGIAAPVSGFELLQNYPNPFNPETAIQFELSTPSHVTLTIFNIAGQQIKTLVNESKQAGSHTVLWNGTNQAGNKVSSGVYFYKLQTENQIAIRRMMMIQ